MRARRGTRAAMAAALVAAMAAGGAVLGAGTATAAPLEVLCSVDLSKPTAPVSVAPGTQVQLVMDLLGSKVPVGPTQTVTTSQTLQGPESPVSPTSGILGSLCKAAVTVQSALPTVPALPPVLPPVAPPPSAPLALPAPASPAGGSGAPADATQRGGTPPSAANNPPPAPAPAAAPPAAAPASGGGAYSGTVDSASLGNLLTPVGSGSAMQFSFGRVPLYSYAGIPFAVAGGPGRAPSPASLYGSKVPGFAPQSAALGAAAAGSGGAGNRVANSSQVEALGVAPTAGTIGVVTLLAVLLLSGTSAAVVRTWVLRRSAPSTPAT